MHCESMESGKDSKYRESYFIRSIGALRLYVESQKDNQVFSWHGCIYYYWIYFWKKSIRNGNYWNSKQLAKVVSELPEAISIPDIQQYVRRSPFSVFYGIKADSFSCPAPSQLVHGDYKIHHIFISVAHRVLGGTTSSAIPRKWLLKTLWNTSKCSFLIFNVLRKRSVTKYELQLTMKVNQRCWKFLFTQ